MMMKVVDDRATTLVHLHEVDFGQWFERGGKLYCRVATDLKVETFPDELLVMNTAGELIGMARDNAVEPLNTEIRIVD